MLGRIREKFREKAQGRSAHSLQNSGTFSSNARNIPDSPMDLPDLLSKSWWYGSSCQAASPNSMSSWHDSSDSLYREEAGRRHSGPHSGSEHGTSERGSGNWPSPSTSSSEARLDVAVHNASNLRALRSSVSPLSPLGSTARPSQAREGRGPSSVAQESYVKKLPPQQAVPVPIQPALGRSPEGASSTSSEAQLGTWAHRQTRFEPSRAHTPGALGMQADNLLVLSPIQSLNLPGRPANGGPAPDGLSPEASLDDDAIRDAAWHWRANRRWRMEQTRQFDPELTGDEDGGWDDALRYLNACGPGFHLQIARTVSTDQTLGASMVSQGSGISTALLADESQRGGLLCHDAIAAEMDATKSIVTVAKKAQELYQQQQQIARAAQERWDITAAGLRWAGQYLSPVAIDFQGRFTYVVLKIEDRLGVQKLLLRGKNNSTEERLVSAFHKEVMDVCAKHGLPNVTLELVGSGTMDWAQREKRLDIWRGSKKFKNGGMPMEDVSRVAASLARASLPHNCSISIEGEKVC